jgi:hypothetical protein
LEPALLWHIVVDDLLDCEPKAAKACELSRVTEQFGAAVIAVVDNRFAQLGPMQTGVAELQMQDVNHPQEDGGGIAHGDVFLHKSAVHESRNRVCDYHFFYITVAPLSPEMLQG